MDARRTKMEKIRQILRQRAEGEGFRTIARNLGLTRNTVREYVREAGKLGIRYEAKMSNEKLLPLLGEPTLRVSEPNELENKLKNWISQGTPLKRCWEEAVKQELFSKGYVTFTRVAAAVRAQSDQADQFKVFVPIETEPGEEAQVDFIDGPKLYNPMIGKTAKTNIFAMRMAYSRADFACFVWRQDVATWLRCFEDAFRFFGGVPSAIRCDNLKSAIIKALYIEPEINKTFSEFAEFYGFIVRNCKVRIARHKGKVERLGQYLQTSFLPLRTYTSIADANVQLTEWLKNTANLRKHGVTLWVPWDEFELIEKSRLKALPESNFEVGLWGDAKLHQDCHVAIDRKLYSAPYQLRGKRLDYRITLTTVQIFFEYKLVGIHEVCRGKEFRKTNPAHLPPAKQAFFEKTPQWCLEQAEKMGEDVFEFVRQLLTKNDHPFDNLRGAQGIIGLGFKHGSKRLSAACKRALLFCNIRYHAINEILKRGLDEVPLPDSDQKKSELQQTELPLPRFARGNESFH